MLDFRNTQRGLAVKRPSGNQKVRGSNPTAVMQVEKRKIGHWDSPLHRKCPNSPAGSEWKTSDVKPN